MKRRSSSKSATPVKKQKLSKSQEKKSKLNSDEDDDFVDQPPVESSASEPSVEEIESEASSNNDEEVEESPRANNKAKTTPSKSNTTKKTSASPGTKRKSLSTVTENGSVSFNDFSDMELKPDHANRPIWVCPNRRIYLETFSPIYKPAYDFLIAIAEPVSRPEYIHEYKITQYSLYAAVSIGLETEDILRVLERLSKVKVPRQVLDYITASTVSFGKVKLLLEKGKYFIESPHREVLEELLKDDVIRAGSLQGELTSSHITLPTDTTAFPSADNITAEIDALDDAPQTQKRRDEAVLSFEINPTSVEDIKRRCIELGHPLVEEYEFRKDTANANISIELKPTTSLRPYQEKSLAKMFNNGRARSGIIALPCGAGKSLVGITACATVKKPTVILCTSSVSVEQWRHQLKLWTSIDDAHIARFTANNKDKLIKQHLGQMHQASNNTSVLITTYTMVAFSGKRSYEAEAIMRFIESREWGLVLLDEVHVVPAKMFRQVLGKIKAHTKLGLTATLVREDEMITDLNFLIGPKLYEANWMDLVRLGHIANVQCSEVWCRMTAEFYKEYLRASPRKQRLLYTLNPNKFRACQHLIQQHEDRGDKILVFSDNVFALKMFAKQLGKEFIYGGTSNTERLRIFSQFQYNASVRTIFISKVGDNSIDLPEANVIIQISSHFGSRRQEAQRLGRILRPKARSDKSNKYDAYFYSLVSQDTHEMYYSSKRQQFLIDQGYSFEVLSAHEWLEAAGNTLTLSTKEEQLHLLTQVLAAEDEQMRDEDDEAQDVDSVELTRALAEEQRTLQYTRTSSNLDALTGAQGMYYYEFND